MKFLLMMAGYEDTWDALSPEEQARIVGRHNAFTRDLETEGKYVCSYRLRSQADARTVRRSEDGEFVITDGPFAETKEALGGIYVIEAESMDEALEWARRSRFMVGSNEVRPIWEG
jgi:hypothetical protein